MRRMLSTAGLLLSLCWADIACAPKTIVTPQGKIAYTADQIALRVTELETTAIQATSTGGLDVKLTRIIVRWCVQAEQTLAATPNGWIVTLRTTWQGVKMQLPVLTNPVLLAAVNAVDVALVALGG